MNPYYSKFGFTSDDMESVRDFEGFAERMGWPRPRIEAAFSWYRDNIRNIGTVEDLGDAFKHFCNREGMDEGDFDQSFTWAEELAEYGPNPASGPAPEQDLAREAEIKEAMAADMDAYWRDENMQREYHEIEARRHARTQETTQHDEGQDGQGGGVQGEGTEAAAGTA